MKARTRRYDNEFDCIEIDACWLIRSGQGEEGRDSLRQKYSHLSELDISDAMGVGDALNSALWDLSVKCWKREIDKQGFLDAIRGICPALTDEMLQFLYDNAMFDSM